MANPEELTKSFHDLEDAIFGTKDSVRELYKDYSTLQDRIKDNTIEVLKGSKSLKDGIAKYKELRTETTKRIQTVANEEKALKKLREEQEKCKKQLAIMSMTTKEKLGQVKKGFDDAAAGVKKFADGVMGLSATLGGATISLSSITKAGIDYDKTLYQLSRSQQVAGRGSQDFAAALAYVKKNTVLSQAQFVEFAKIVQDGFLGLKPSMMDIAQLSEQLASKVGPSAEAQKAAMQELIGIQGRFPAIYEEIMALMNKSRYISEQGTQAEKENFKARRASLQIRMQETGMIKESEFMLQVTAEQTKEQEKLTKAMSAQQRMNKELEDAQIKMYESLKPLLTFAMKTIAKIAEISSEWVDTITVATAAIVVLTGAQKALNIAAAMNPYIRIGMAIAACGIGIVSLINKQKIANKQAQEQEKAVALEVKRQQDKVGLSAKQIKQLDDQFQKVKETGASVEDQALAWDKSVMKVKKQEEEIAKMRQDLPRILQNVEQEVALLDKVTGSLKTQVALAEEFGMVNEKALAGLVDRARVTKDKIAKGLQKAIDIVAKEYADKGLKIPIDFTSDIGTQSEQLQAHLLGQLRDTNLESEEREKIESRLVSISKTINDYKQKEADITRAQTAYINKAIKQQEQMTSAYEARLDTERKLMESAQFGMGASIEMMQKQVDLAYKMMQTYADADKEYQKLLKDQKIATDYDIQRIQNAQTQAEAEDYIKNVMKAQGQEQQLLNRYAVQHQQYSQKTMEQQQKIYDLTKDIREGYLDAIREMSTGAGEFEKIIGTQDMGVTQLMDSVKDVTGVAKLNTMALGGLQEQALTGAGVGTQAAGKYGAGGLEFIGGETQEARNQRIYQYGESKAKAEASMRGEVAPGGAPTVGSALVPGATETYMPPEREAEIQGKIMAGEIAGAIKETITGDGMVGAIVKGARDSSVRRINKSDMTDAVNVGVKKGKFNVGEVEKLRATAVTSGAMGHEYLDRGKTPERASGGYVNIRTDQGVKNRLPEVQKLMQLYDKEAKIQGKLSEFYDKQASSISAQIKEKYALSNADEGALYAAKNIMQVQDHITKNMKISGQAAINLRDDMVKYQETVGKAEESWDKMVDANENFWKIAEKSQKSAQQSLRVMEVKGGRYIYGARTGSTPLEKEETARAEEQKKVVEEKKKEERKSAMEVVAAAGASKPQGDILDLIAEKEKKYALPMMGLGAVGLMGKFVQSRAAGSVASKYAGWEKGAASAEDIFTKNIMGRKNLTLIEKQNIISTQAKAAGERHVARMYGANQGSLARSQRAANIRGRVGTLKSVGGGIAGGLGGEMLLTDMARDFGAGEKGQKIAGGIGGLGGAAIGMASPVTGAALLAGAGGYKLGTYIDKKLGISETFGEGGIYGMGWAGFGGAQPMSGSSIKGYDSDKKARRANRERWAKEAAEKKKKEAEESAKIEEAAKQAEEQRLKAQAEAETKRIEQENIANKKAAKEKIQAERKMKEDADAAKGYYKGIKRKSPEEAAKLLKEGRERRERGEGAYQGRGIISSGGVIRDSAGAVIGVAGTPSAAQVDPAKKAAEDEMGKRADDIRKQIGKVKPKKGQTQAQAEYEKANQMFLQQHVEKWSKEEFEQRQKDLQAIKSGKKGPKEGTWKAKDVEADPAKSTVYSKAYTSAAAERGEEATTEQQAAFQEQRGALASMVGATGDAEGGGGGGMATVLVSLSPGLMAKVEDASGVAVEVQQGAEA